MPGDSIYKGSLLVFFETRKIPLTNEEENDKNKLINKFVQHLDLTQIKEIIKTHKITVGPNAKKEKYFQDKLIEFLQKNYQEEKDGFRITHKISASYVYKEYSKPFKKLFKERKKSDRQTKSPVGVYAFEIPYRKSNTPHEEYVKEKERQRKRKAWHIQTEEQHEARLRQMRERRGGMPYTASNINMGEIYNERRRLRKIKEAHDQDPIFELDRPKPRAKFL